MKSISLLQDIRSGKTVSGLEILLPWSHRENYLRVVVHDLSLTIAEYLELQNIADDLLRQTIVQLRSSYQNRRRNRVKTDQKGKSSRALRSQHTSALDYWVYFNLLISGDDGLAHPQRLKLDAQITYEVLFGLIGLLLIDSAVAHLNRGAWVHAAVELLHATDACEEMLHSTQADAWTKQVRTITARTAGKARHSKTNKLRRIILEKWDAGVFGNNKSRAALWAAEKYEINPETVRRWIRAHDN